MRSIASMHIIPPFQPLTVTLFAVLLPEPTSIVPYAVKAGLALVCGIVAAFGLLRGFRRDREERKEGGNAISEFPLVHARPKHDVKNDLVET
jgi:hypothetical protein